MTADDVFVYANWLGVLALAVGVICACAIAISGKIRDDRLKFELGAQKERTEELRASNLALQAQIEPRRLTDVQVDELRQIFAKFPGQAIRVSSYALDADAAIFGGQILRAVEEAGLPRDDKRMSQDAIGALLIGISITGTNPSLVRDLLSALRDFDAGPGPPPPTAGISMGGQNVPLPAKIFIGVKPLPE